MTIKTPHISERLKCYHEYQNVVDFARTFVQILKFHKF